jgi:HAD superfamily hydrolase (TIGR01490 family)
MSLAGSHVQAASTVQRGYCFFDVDETLVSFKTMHSFLDYYLRHDGPYSRLLGNYRAWRAKRRLGSLELAGESRENINRAYYRMFRGHKVANVRQAARLWFAELRHQVDPFYLPATLRLAREHRAAGRELVLISGSSVDILAPIAEELSAAHVLATRMRVVDDRYTGEIIPPQTIGAGKAVAVRDFLGKTGTAGKLCFAYGDHVSDFPMLALVGHPVVVTSDPATSALAKKHDFETLDPYRA